MRPFDDAAKRLTDVLLAGLLVVATLPLWAVVGIIIKLTSSGPVLYRGERVGKGGAVFGMYKFRTMHAGADRAGPAITAGDDPRITSVGRWLRATKLDELPQLLNVLRGEMSLVGPRPEAPRYVAYYDDRQREVLTVRPGITGPSQLVYRHEERMLIHHDVDRQYRLEVMPRKLESDLAYIRDRSWGRDISLLVATGRRLAQRGEGRNEAV